MLNKRTAITLTITVLLSCQLMAEDNKRPVEKILKDRAEASAERVPIEFQQLTQEGFNELDNSGIIDSALNVGDKAPSFKLPDAHGNIVDSENLLKNGSLVIVFYRGAWCPYCNIYLNQFEKYLPQLKELNSSIVAISAEPPDRSLEVEQKDSLTYPVLSDTGLVVSKQFGIVFEVPNSIQEAMGKFDFDFLKYYSSDKAELPLSATYVVNPNGEIIYSFLEIDYKLRAEPIDVIEAIKANQ